MKKLAVLFSIMLFPLISISGAQDFYSEEVKSFETEDIVEDVIFCAYKKARELKDIVKSSKRRARDKFRHCTISCAVSLECDVASTSILGIAKEVYDIFGPGSAEWEDLYANLIGVSLSWHSSINSLDDCVEACREYYP